MSPDNGMWLLAALMLVVWAGIIGTLVWMVSLPADPDLRPPPDEARRLLEQRFVRGEIDAHEYFDRLEALERDTAGRRGGEQPCRTSDSSSSRTTTASLRR